MARDPHESTAPLGSTTSSGRRVPTGIKIIAALNVIGALLSLSIVGRFFTLSHPLALPLGLFFLALIGAGLVFTYGLVTLQYWGWLGILGFQLLSGIVNLVTFDLLGLLISGFILFYLLGQQDLYRNR